jgi:hypothetical protein
MPFEVNVFSLQLFPRQNSFSKIHIDGSERRGKQLFNALLGGSFLE